MEERKKESKGRNEGRKGQNKGGQREKAEKDRKEREFLGLNPSQATYYM